MNTVSVKLFDTEILKDFRLNYIRVSNGKRTAIIGIIGVILPFIQPTLHAICISFKVPAVCMLEFLTGWYIHVKFYPWYRIIHLTDIDSSADNSKFKIQKLFHFLNISIEYDITLIEQSECSVTQVEINKTVDVLLDKIEQVHA